MSNNEDSSNKKKTVKVSVLEVDDDDVDDGHSIADTTGFQESTPREFCAKTILLLSSLAFLVGGSCAVASYDAAIVDLFYPDDKDPTKFGDDVTVTLFFDGVVCHDGSCYDFIVDPFACQAMRDTISNTRAASLCLGIGMLLACVCITVTTLTRSLNRLFGFVMWKCCRQRTSSKNNMCCCSISESAAARLRSVFLFIGVLFMLGLLGLAIDVIHETFRIAYKPLCDSSGEQASTVYNISISELVPQFSWGRALHLNFGAGLIVCGVDFSLIVWFCVHVCGNWSNLDDELEDEDNARDANYESLHDPAYVPTEGRDAIQ